MMMSAAVVVVVVVLGAVDGASLAIPRARLNPLDCGDTNMKPGERVVVQSPNFPQNYDVNYRYDLCRSSRPLGTFLTTIFNLWRLL